jgi:RimK family alpha-L-glutamate ligase
MQVTILNAGTGWHTDDLCRALAERGHAGTVRPYECLVARLGGRHADTGGLSSAGTAIFEADAVLARIIPIGSLEQIIYRVNALHWVEAHGVKVMNSPRAIERTVDKFYTTALLQEAGLPTPETVVCETMAEAMEAVRTMRDVVVKPIFGSMGHGLVRLSDPDVAFRVLQSLEQMRAVFYVQRAIDPVADDARDVRVFVVGGRIVGAIERRAPAGDWRTNVSRGGSTRAFDVPPAWQQIALRAAAVVGADYAGVDLLPSRDGAVFVLEVNGVPGWQGLKQTTGIDVAGAIVDHLAALVRAPRVAAELSARGRESTLEAARQRSGGSERGWGPARGDQ